MQKFRIENKNKLNEKKHTLNGWENIMQNQWTGEPKQESLMTGLNLVIKKYLWIEEKNAMVK